MLGVVVEGGLLLGLDFGHPLVNKRNSVRRQGETEQAEDEGDPSISPPVLQMLSAAPCYIACVCNYLHEVLVLELGVVRP